MRRTGKTTRLVDICVQKLFETGEVHIPKTLPESTNDNMVIDTDAATGSFTCAQHHLRTRFLRRMLNEHPHVKLNFKSEKISII